MLPALKPSDPRTFIGYKQVHDALKLELVDATFGRSLQKQGLDSLAEWTVHTGKPGITGLVIDKEELSPGPGYYRLFGRKRDDVNWWLAEVRRAVDFDWGPFLAAEDALASDGSTEWTRDELRASVVAYLVS